MHTSAAEIRTYSLENTEMIIPIEEDITVISGK